MVEMLSRVARVPGAFVRGQQRSVMTQVMFDERRDEVIAVVVALMKAQLELLSRLPTSFFQQMR